MRREKHERVKMAVAYDVLKLYAKMSGRMAAFYVGQIFGESVTQGTLERYTQEHLEECTELLKK